MNFEVEAIRQRYARREQLPEAMRYDPLQVDRYMNYAEKRRALICWITWAKLSPVQNKRVLEIGCGTGENLLQLMSLGFQPEHLVGNELLEARASKARHTLPAATQILVGDASTMSLEHGSFDVVLQATVFTSILDNAFQQTLAQQMWSWVKPGGGVLWYDFVFDNPSNPDVRGVSIQRVRALFPSAMVKVWRLTLAPPISRRVSKIHPNLYSVFNQLPFLRSHVLCWIQKPSV